MDPSSEESSPNQGNICSSDGRCVLLHEQLSLVRVGIFGGHDLMDHVLYSKVSHTSGAGHDSHSCDHPCVRNMSHTMGEDNDAGRD